MIIISKNYFKIHSFMITKSFRHFSVFQVNGWKLSSNANSIGSDVSVKTQNVDNTDSTKRKGYIKEYYAKLKEKKAKALENITAGKYLYDMQNRGKGGKELSLGELNKLFELCTLPEHASYIPHGINLYQMKRQDFSESTAAEFIRASIRVNSPKVAATICLKYKNRISAWITPNLLTELVDSLLNQGEIEVTVGMLEVISKKGVKARSVTMESILKVVSSNDQHKVAYYSKALSAASMMLEKEAYDELLKQYPPLEITPENVDTTSSS